MTAENKVEEARSKKGFKKKKLVIILSVLLAVILLLAGAVAVILKIGENKLKKPTVGEAQLPTIGEEELPPDADAYYNGVAYDYKQNLVNILVLGVDREKIGNNSSQQADVLYLVSLDAEQNNVNAIAISRNTIAKIDTLDISGEEFSSVEQQICLAYTYGTDEKQASENTVKAVSRLLYNLPINGYYTIYMNSIKEIVDSVGGVPMVLTEDMTDISYKYKKGASVTISGWEALKFLRYRQDSNVPRYERQKAFVSSFVSQAKQAVLKDLSLPLKMYNKLSANTITNVDATSAVYLASEAVKANFNMHGIEGTSGFDGEFETFIPDEEKLYTLLLDVFYKKQK